MGVFEDYFLNPILANGWFNPVNTITYAVILIVAVLLVFKLLFRMGIKIDKYFMYAILPFIFWGSSTRVLHDAAVARVLSPELTAIFGSNIFPTPGSYFITFTFAIVVMLASLAVMRTTRIPYWKPMMVVGIIASLVNIWLLPWVSFIPFLLVVGILALWMGLFYVLSVAFKHPFFSRRHLHLNRLFSKTNQAILGAHLLDAAATFISLSLYGYREQHVLPRFVFQFADPVSFFLLKIAVVLPVLWVLDTYSDDKNFRNFLKIVVFILGAAPGLRDLIRLMVGV